MARTIFYNHVLPFIAVVAADCASVGLNTLFKAASLEGLSYYVFIVYSYALNTLILLPIPFIFCSKTKLPSRRFPLLSRIILLGLTGLAASIFGLKGIEYSSPTLASAMGNLTPAFTFTLAIIFRMEKLDLRSSSFQAEIIGTIVSISGALVVVLCKGPTILSIPSPAPPMPVHQSLELSQSNWVIGGLLLAAEYLLYSSGYIIMTQIMKMYPAELMVTFFYNLCITVLSIPVCIIAEPELNAWRLGSNTALVVLIYSGFFGAAFITVIHVWCVHLKGPVYVAIFKPLSIAIAVVMGVIFLGDALHLGSIIGSLILSIGVYAVLWGKAKEERMMEECSPSSLGSSSNFKVPLLKDEEVEDV